ncbi:MAG: rubrerythrin family protein [Candidatus Altiarchaeales archaeon]|nr:rubrerythrin family protein [Candidatus Altiarchaeales archaeon]
MRALLRSQRNEITEHEIYNRLAESCELDFNSRVLREVGEEELRHYEIFRKYTQKDVEKDRIKIWYYYFLSRIFGVTFGVKLMERGEADAQKTYEEIAQHIPEIQKVAQEEDEHEQKLLNELDEEKLKYVGSIVLGLNDALVELTGALAGFTLALNDANLVAVTGLITGIAASLSMAASEYLSTKSDENEKHPKKAAIYTGGAYLTTVILLILPYLLLENILLSLAWTLVNAVTVIAFFTFYISVAKDEDFKERFAEMSTISLGVAAISFAIGYLVKITLRVDVE